MPPPQEGRLCFAQRAALLLWIAAQVMNASSLPANPKGSTAPGSQAPGSRHRRPASASFRSGRRCGNTQFHVPQPCGQTGVSYRVVARFEAVGSPFACWRTKRPVAGRRAADLDVTGRRNRDDGDNQQPPSPPPHIHGMPPHGRTRGPNKKAAPNPWQGESAAVESSGDS